MNIDEAKIAEIVTRCRDVAFRRVMMETKRRLYWEHVLRGLLIRKVQPDAGIDPTHRAGPGGDR